jgi:hypothetical protein
LDHHGFDGTYTSIVEWSFIRINNLEHLFTRHFSDSLYIHTCYLLFIVLCHVLLFIIIIYLLLLSSWPFDFTENFPSVIYQIIILFVISLFWTNLSRHVSPNLMIYFNFFFQALMHSFGLSNHCTIDRCLYDWDIPSCRKERHLSNCWFLLMKLSSWTHLRLNIN